MTKFNSQNTTNQNLINAADSVNLRQSQIPQITKINDGIAGFLVAKSLWLAAKNLVNFFFAAPKEEKNNAIEDVEKGEESKESKQLFISDSYHSIDVERNPERSFNTIRKTNALIEKNPQDSAAYFDRGCAYFDLAVKFKHHQNNDIVHFKNKEVSDFIRSHLGMPNILNNDKKNFKAAIIQANADFDKALEFDKSNVEILFKKGLVNYIAADTHNLRFAVESFAKALEINPKTKLANHYLGLISLNYGKFDEEKKYFSKKNTHRAESEEFFKKEIEINENSNSYEQLGRIKLGKAAHQKRGGVKRKIIEEARKDFYKALELNPTAKSINFYIGKSYFDEEKLDTALAFFEKETANRPSKEDTYLINAKSFSEIARIHQIQGNHTQAIEDFKSAAKEIGYRMRFRDAIFKQADISYSALNKTREEKNEFKVTLPLTSTYSLMNYVDDVMQKNKKRPTTSTKLESFKKLSPNQQTNNQTTHF